MSPGGEAGPRRTCVACRVEEAREDLVRLVWSPDDDLVVDLRGGLPGRGAWVHPARPCLERVQAEPGLLGRALREPDAARRPFDALALVREAVARALSDGLSQAAAGGGLVFGHDAVDAAVGNGEVIGLLFASDAAERTIASVSRPGVPTATLPLDRDAFGQRVGQGLIAVAGVRSVPGTVHLRRQLRRWTRLG